MDTRTCRDAMVGPMRILGTTTSFQDTPGAHHDVLAARGFDIVHVRGSGVTWREATKYLPAAMKRELEKARLGRTAAR